MKKALKMVVTIAFTLALFAVTRQVIAEETDYLQKLSAPDYDTRIGALKSLEDSPADSPEVYDFIKTKLINGFALKRGKHHTNEMSWICTALASTGDEQYLPILKQVAESEYNKKLRRHCKESITLHKEVAQKLGGAPITGYSKVMSRNIRMLQSGRSSWMRTSAINIEKSEERTEQVFDMVRDTLLAEVTRIGGDDSLLSDVKRFKRMYEIDTLGYLCHCLGTSGKAKYKADLEKVIAATVHVNLKSHARKAIAALPKK
ncbi:MAG: hypothetical protein OEL83_19190 [Desulforhopalus sp.]|nr:hypothetical protein [Desulforhopalus sp.]